MFSNDFSLHSVLRVISSHRGSLSPDDIDSLLAVKNASFVSRKTSGEETTTGGSQFHDTTTTDDDLKLLPVSPSVPEKSFSKEEGGARGGGGGGMEKTRESSSMLSRRSSHTFSAAALRVGGGGGGGGQGRDETIIEDVETTDSFRVQTTLVSSGNGKVTSTDDQDRSDIRVSELRDTDGLSSQGSPIDNVGVSSHAHIYHQEQATPPGPGPLHMAAKYVP